MRLQWIMPFPLFEVVFGNHDHEIASLEVIIDWYSSTVFCCTHTQEAEDLVDCLGALTRPGY